MIKFGRLIKSFTYSIKGLWRVIREEQNLKIQLIAGTLVLLLAWFFGLKTWEWSILIIMIALVFLAEVINSAVERVTDVLKPRISDYVKEIKDIMAAAVMITALASIIIGILIFLPYFIHFLH